MGYTQPNNSSEETVASNIHINLSIIIMDMIRNLVTVIILSMIIAGTAYVVKEHTAKPKYQSAVSLLLSSADGSTSAASNDSTVTLLQEILDSSLLEKIVAADLGLDTTTVPATITTTVRTDVSVVNVVVTADTPRMAFLVMNSMIENYSQVSDYLMDGLVLEVLEPASIPYRPVVQTGARQLFSMVFRYSFAILMVCVIILSFMRDTVKSEMDIYNKLDTQLFATIYRERNQAQLELRRKQKRSGIKKKGKKSLLINRQDVSFSFVETFKKIRTKLEYEARKNGSRVIMVTSVMENEGKSTVAANIALALAQKSDKVVLLDADFRKPAQYKVFDAGTCEYGLGDVLHGKCSSEDTIRRYEPAGLYCLYNYVSYRDSAEMLMSREMQDLIAELREKMDYVIIDTPPTALVADAEIVSRYADAALLVVREDRAKTGEINDTIDMLSGSRSRLLGCIYNCVGRGFGRMIQNSDAYGSYRYGKYGKYGYGYGEGASSISESEPNTEEQKNSSGRERA